MLSSLDTLKARLVIDPLEVKYDDLLTNTLLALSTRFDRETNRTLGTESVTCDQLTIHLD